MSDAFDAQIVIAVHNTDRPVKRAASSVLRSPGVGVIVVAHGIDSASLDLPEDSRIRVIECQEGKGHPGIPFNRGVQSATARFVGIMGSDDEYEPNAVSAMVRRLTDDEADGVIAPLIRDDSSGIRSKAPFTHRNKNLQAARDRLFYRTAPLGLFRTEVFSNGRYLMREDLHNGIDLIPSVRLWTDGLSISYYPTDPAYIVHSDAKDRVTEVRKSFAEKHWALTQFLDGGYAEHLPNEDKASLAVKLLRIHIFGFLRRTGKRSIGVEDWSELADTTRKILALSPHAMSPFTRSEKTMAQAILEEDGEKAFAACIKDQTEKGFWRRLPASPIHFWTIDGTPRRYVTQALCVLQDRTVTVER